MLYVSFSCFLFGLHPGLGQATRYFWDSFHICWESSVPTLRHTQTVSISISTALQLHPDQIISWSWSCNCRIGVKYNDRTESIGGWRHDEFYRIPGVLEDKHDQEVVEVRLKRLRRSESELGHSVVGNFSMSALDWSGRHISRITFWRRRLGLKWSEVIRNIRTARKPGQRFIAFWTSSHVLNTWNAAFSTVFCWLICRVYWFMSALLLRVAKNHCFTTALTSEFYLVQTCKIRNVFSWFWKHKTKLSLW